MSTLLFFALLMSLSCCEIQGVHKLSGETNTNFTFQLGNDVEYDCVDIYKQPAFNNILLKNHKIQMEPNFLLGSKKKMILSKFEPDACPPGTVPIYRTNVNNKNPLRYASNLHLGNIYPQTEREPGIHYAVYGKKMDSKFNGAGAMIDLRNPSVGNDQVSAAQIWVGAGPPEQLNCIQLGWQVHPKLYGGDSQTRLTAFWIVRRDNNKEIGCYNYLCPGFVQVNPKYFLGRAFPNMSVDGGPYFLTQPQIKLEQGTGNWWLMIEEDIILGYYPKELFTNLNEGADLIQFGGWTYSPSGSTSPPMGNGFFPIDDYDKCSYFAQIGFIDKEGHLVDIIASKMNRYVDNDKCYDVKAWGYRKGGFRETFAFGGPGGKCGT